MIEGNSFIDETKDVIRACLLKHGVSQDKANEMTYDLADNVFDTLAISAEYQDNSYEYEVTELVNFYEARESIPVPYQEEN